MGRPEHMERVLRKRFGIAGAAVVEIAGKKNDRMTKNGCNGRQCLPSGNVTDS